MPCRVPIQILLMANGSWYLLQQKSFNLRQRRAKGFVLGNQQANGAILEGSIKIWECNKRYGRDVGNERSNRDGCRGSITFAFSALNFQWSGFLCFDNLGSVW